MSGVEAQASLSFALRAFSCCVVKLHKNSA